MRAIGIPNEEIRRRSLCLLGFRHFFATFSQAAGINSFLASKLTPHKSIRFFETYSDHFEVVQMDEARKGLGGP